MGSSLNDCELRLIISVPAGLRSSLSGDIPDRASFMPGWSYLESVLGICFILFFFSCPVTPVQASEGCCDLHGN